MSHAPAPRPATFGSLQVMLHPVTMGAMLPVLDDFAVLQGMKGARTPNTAEVQAMIRVVHASVSVGASTPTLQEFSDRVLHLPFLEALDALSRAFGVVTELSVPPGDPSQGEAKGS